LLNAADFGPDQADIGDRLELIGTGFPEGKPATVTFRGNLHRPGREPIRDVEIVAATTSTSQARVSLVLTEELYAEFTGRGPEASHTTFHGDVIGAFAPRNRGAPPIQGIVHDVVLDLPAPPWGTDALAARNAEGQRLLEFSGITIDPTNTQNLVVQALAPGGRGERAALEVGDRLLEFEGVRIGSVADLIPSNKRRSVSILVQHGRLRDAVIRTLDVDGFRAHAPEELSGAGMLVGLASAILLLFAAPVARVITWVERRAAGRLTTVRRTGALAQVRRGRLLGDVALSFWESLPAPLIDKPWLRLVLYLTVLSSTTVLTLLAFGHGFFVPELELLLLFVTSLTAVSVTALILGGWRDDGSWSLLAGLKNAALVMACQVPACAAIGAVLLTTGSLRLDDVVGAQSGAPWHWHAFRSPSLLLMSLLFLASAVPEVSRARLQMPELESERRHAAEPTHPASRALTYFAEWASLVLASGIGAILFLGGWQLPFVSPAEQHQSLMYQGLGALLVMLKCWAIVGIVLAVRWALPEVRIEQVMVFWWRWLIPLSGLGLAGSFLWMHGLESPVLREIQAGLGSVLFALMLFVFGYLVQRVARGMRQPNPHASVNPWL
jgi:NADH-quinone oxidoreductase subunit H